MAWGEGRVIALDFPVYLKNCEQVSSPSVFVVLHNNVSPSAPRESFELENAYIIKQWVECSYGFV